MVSVNASPRSKCSNEEKKNPGSLNGERRGIRHPVTTTVRGGAEEDFNYSGHEKYKRPARVLFVIVKIP